MDPLLEVMYSLQSWCSVSLVLILYTCFFVDSQHMPPGVNPRQYGNQPVVQHPPQVNPQQYQQQHYQQQQHIPQQQMHHQQQVHQQQQQQIHPQQQVHHQQQPHQQHHSHHGQAQVLNMGNLMEEKEHIAEHLAVPMDTSKMSEQELQFHYFKMHDADNNNKLDGCELIKSLIHWHEQGHTDPSTGGKVPAEEKLFKDDELISLIDPILQMDDLNADGYIDYPEFVKAQQKAAQGQQAHR